MVAKKNEKQTEIDFDKKPMSDSDLDQEIKRIRVNLGKYIRRGDTALARKTNDELARLLSESISRGNKPLPPIKNDGSAESRLQEFFSRVPKPTILEQALYITALSQKWNGSRGGLAKIAMRVSGHSSASIYRLLFVGSRLTGEAIALLSTHELANKNVHLLDKVAHLPENKQADKRALDKILKASRRGYAKVATATKSKEKPTYGYSVGPQPGQVSFPGKEPSKAETKEQVLAREDYHHIARIIGAQNNELRLKLKEILTENHKSDLQGQIDVARTMNHILKELQEIRKLLTNNTTAPAIESAAPAASERCPGEY